MNDKDKADLIEEFEAQTGLDFDPEGPLPCECEECGQLLQFIPDHNCFYVRAESKAARRFEEMAHGNGQDD